MQPLVSIILPTYNANKKWLCEAINSVFNQSYKNFELVIIHDDNNNDIRQTIDMYIKFKKKIIYLKSKKKTLVNALNLWIKKSKGIYIARIDDDDIRDDKSKLQKQVNFLNKNLDYGLIGAWIIYKIDENWKNIWQINMRISNNEIKKYMLQACQIAHPSIMVRREILEKTGIYDPQLKMAEDYDLWLRIWRITKIYNLENVSIKYRLRGDSLGHNNIYKQKIITLKLCIKYRKYYPNFFKSLILRIIELPLPRYITENFLNIVKK